MSPVSVGFKTPMKGEKRDDAAGDAASKDKREKQAEALVARATYEFRRGEFERARMLAKYLKDIEGFPDGVRIFALCCHQMGDEDSAWEHYPAAYEAFPDDLNVIVGYAELCLSRIELQRAHELLTRALERDPDASHEAGAKARILILRAERAA
jgi:tetratricopeptide (TPR) repeat protein